MKKLFFGASLVLLAVGFSSCAKVASPETFEFDVLASDWVANGTTGTSNFSYDYNKSLSAINDAVMTSGAVLGYINLGGQWGALPYTQTYSTYTKNYNYQYTTGTVFIRIKDSDLNTFPPVGTLTFKIIVLTQKEMHLLEGVDVNNYSAVAEVLNLKD